MPIHDLPPELVELIFLQCHNAVDLYPMPVSSDAPLNLSQTCKHWKDIAYGLPSLWSKLKVVASHTASGPPVQVVERWMFLSAAHPLSFVPTADPKVLSDLGVSRVLELFLSNMYRWRAVSFDFSQFAPPIKQPTSQSAPQLERFEIYPFSWSPLLGALAVPWLAAALQIPSRTFLSNTLGTAHLPPLGDWTLGFRVSFHLQSASNLIECHLLNVRHEFLEDVPAFDPLLPPVLPHLTTLSLASQVGFDRIFRLLVAPDLRTLEIATRSTQMRWDHAQFMAFLRRSLCSITSLTMRDLFVSRLAHTELRELFMHVSDSLTHLAITSDIPGTPVGIHDALLRALSYRPTGPVLCPQLEYLTLQIGAFVTDGELGKMIESRWEGHHRAPARIARLHHIDIMCATETHTADVLALNRLLKEGLEGKVRTLGDIENDTDSGVQRSFRRLSLQR
ncbi:hypothetical protein B0H14DRAFT_3479600 [Mycena olivaceomarginata]|nr:hypothetical protein B0H14DRAFT_3479600 [Mycena olivaceomarginata]